MLNFYDLSCLSIIRIYSSLYIRKMKNNSSDDKRLILLIGGTSSYSKSFSTKR